MPNRADRRRTHERRTALIALAVAIVLMAGVAAGVYGYYAWATGASGPRRPVAVRVEQGMTGADVADLLAKDHVVRSSFAFRWFARVRGYSAGFTAGIYRLTTNMTVADALEVLLKGPAAPLVDGIKILIPEGLTLRQIAARVGAAVGSSPKEILAAGRSGKLALPPYLPNGTHTVEGFLFPNTYFLPRHMKPHAVITYLLDQFGQQVRSLPWGNAKKLGLTPYQVVIEASLIEREAAFPRDRVRVARVLDNRLKARMPLEIDATVEYALGTWKPVLTAADYKIKSRYNTYLYPGLPPTPIASPGLAALRAALEPAPGNWLYYLVTSKDGHESFTASYSQFLQWRAQQAAG